MLESKSYFRYIEAQKSTHKNQTKSLAKSTKTSKILFADLRNLNATPLF